LIDRECELQVLRRLRRRNIGPRVLGTFINGRFEEFLYAKPLTPQDLRIPETSRQIAKRMRELHDGIDLLEEEREGGPFVWKNWDRWVDRCERVASWLDSEITLAQNESRSRSAPYQRRGFVCGVRWPVFRNVVDTYRKWLDSSSGGAAAIKQRLVFAHNDVSEKTLRSKRNSPV
jgi:choline kinase